MEWVPSAAGDRARTRSLLKRLSRAILSAEKRERKQSERRAAIRIQSVWRGICGRQTAAAVLIQARGYLGRFLLHGLLIAKAENAAMLRIQRWYRRVVARRRLAEIRQQVQAKRIVELLSLVVCVCACMAPANADDWKPNCSYQSLAMGFSGIYGLIVGVYLLGYTLVIFIGGGG